MIQAPPRTILEVFESLPEGTLAQIVNHQLIMSPAPHPNHQRLSRAIFRQLDSFVEQHRLGEAFYAQADIYLDAGNVYQPDIFFVSTERLFIIQDKFEGAPDFVIEILSQGSEKIDKVRKKAGYEKAGVKEYWIVNPNSKEVAGYRLAEGSFVEIPSRAGNIQSSLLGLTITF